MTVLVSLESQPDFDINIQPEEDGPKGWMDDELVPYVLEQMEAGNEWAWCQVTVTASVGFDDHRFTGGAFLGGCSYRNEEDFIKPEFVVYPKGSGETKRTGYYQEMKVEAEEDLVTQLEPVARWLAAEIRGDDWWGLYGIDPGRYDETEVVFDDDSAAYVILRNTKNKAEIHVSNVVFVWMKKKILQADAPKLGLVD